MSTVTKWSLTVKTERGRHMAVLEATEPKEVFRFFEELSQIPRGTYHTKEVSDYCVKFARERNLEVIQDAWNNVIIKKPGSKGYEKSEPVIIQGHLDMVCEKTPDSDHDFLTDPLELMIEDGFVTAKDTTLGADDGIAIAFALAVLDSEVLAHPPIEAVFTVDEEVGMDGAANIDLSVLKGSMLLNLDSEDDDTLIAGCAGGFRFSCEVPVEKKKVQGIGLLVEICGLKGGHSGVEIDRQWGNANKLAGRLFYHLVREQNLYLAELNGGARDNVIPSVSKMTFVAEDGEKAIQTIHGMKAIWQQEFGTDEPDLDIQITELGKNEYSVLDEESQKNVIGFLVSCPNGVDEFSRSLKGLVETSDNLGVVETKEKSVRFMVLVRSGIASKMEAFKERLICLAERMGGSWNVDSEYPAWTYKEHSRIRPIAAEAFEEVFGIRPKVTTIHAGLECGLLSGKKPELDCVSFGPHMEDIHSFHERLEIASTQKIWNVLKIILKRCK